VGFIRDRLSSFGRKASIFVGVGGEAGILWCALLFSEAPI